MKLVVFGSESNEELKSIAIKYFKDVPLNPNAKLNILR